MELQYLIALLLLLGASIQDFRTRLVNDWFSILLIVVALIFSSNRMYTLFFMLVVFLISYAFFQLNWWGGADVKLITGIAGIIGWNNLFVNYLIFMFSFGLLFSLIYFFIEWKKTKKLNFRVAFPFVPSMFFAFVLLLLNGSYIFKFTY